MSNRDIARFFECDESVIRARFGPQIEKAYAERHAKLRERQWQRAMEGSDTMLIWLGKNELKQTDKLETKNDTTHHAEIVIHEDAIE